MLHSVAYRFMLDEIQHRIFLNELSKLKVGDNYSTLKKALPGEFDNGFKNEYNSVSFFSIGGGPLGDYEIEVKNDTITILKVLRK